MTTTYQDYVVRVEATGTKPSGVNTPAIVWIPEGAYDLTLYAVADAAATCKVEESPSSRASIGSGTPTPTWMSVDASLDSVGTTMVRFALGNRTPVALRVTCLTNDKNATLILVGKRSR